MFLFSNPKHFSLEWFWSYLWCSICFLWNEENWRNLLITLYHPLKHCTGQYLFCMLQPIREQIGHLTIINRVQTCSACSLAVPFLPNCLMTGIMATQKNLKMLMNKRKIKNSSASTWACSGIYRFFDTTLTFLFEWFCLYPFPNYLDKILLH